MTEKMQQLPITENIDASARAARYFATASRKHPASATAQAACIARLCKGAGQSSPVILLKAVLGDTDKLDALAHAATAIHAARMNGPKNSAGSLEPITPERIRDTIITDFTFAEWMMILTENQLDEILTEYSHFHGLNHTGYAREGESLYRAFAQSMIRDTLTLHTRHRQTSVISAER